MEVDVRRSGATRWPRETPCGLLQYLLGVINEGHVIKVSPSELLRFFDEKPPESGGHATAIVAVAGEELGVALLLEYLRSIGRQATALLGPVTPGTTKGARLDRWVKVSDQPPLLYQVEIWLARTSTGRMYSFHPNLYASI